MIAAGTLGPEDLGLFRFAESPEQTWAALIEGGLTPGREPPWELARDIHR